MSVTVRVTWKNGEDLHTRVLGLPTEDEYFKADVAFGAREDQHHVIFIEHGGKFIAIESSAITSIFLVEEPLPKEKQPHVGREPDSARRGQQRGARRRGVRRAGGADQ